MHQRPGSVGAIAAVVAAVPVAAWSAPCWLSVCRMLLVLVLVWEEGGKKVAGNWRGHGAVGHRPDDSL